MSCHWIFLEEGETRGPVSTEELLRQIQQYKLGAFHLICKEGEECWKPAGEFLELSAKFQAMDMEADWIVLRNTGGESLQRGLFSTDELKSLLKQRIIKMGDFAWRSGMAQWCRIYELEVFRQFFLREDEDSLDEEREEVTEVTQTQFMEAVMEESPINVPQVGEIFSEEEGEEPPLRAD